MADPIRDLAHPGLLVYRNAALKATAVKVKGDSIKGNVYAWKVHNLDVTDTYLHFYDAATPTVGTDTPKLTIWVPASGADDLITAAPTEFLTAIYLAATTTITGNTNPTNGLLVNVWYF